MSKTKTILTRVLVAIALIVFCGFGAVTLSACGDGTDTGALTCSKTSITAYKGEDIATALNAEDVKFSFAGGKDINGKEIAAWTEEKNFAGAVAAGMKYYGWNTAFTNTEGGGIVNGDSQGDTLEREVTFTYQGYSCVVRYTVKNEARPSAQPAKP